MSEAELKAVEQQMSSILPADVLSPSIPVSVFCYQGELMMAALQADRARLEAAGLPPDTVESLAVRLGALATAEANWQVFRLQGRPAAQNALEESAYRLRDESYATIEWGLRDHPEALAVLPRIREGTGLADLCADLEALATLVRTNAANFAIPGFDACSWAEVCEAKAAELRKSAADWKIGSSQAELLDRRNRAHTLACQTMSQVRAAAQYAFRNETDTRRMSAYRDQYTSDRQRRSRARNTLQPTPQPPTPLTPA